MKQNVKIVLDEGASIPIYKHPTDAGADIRANEDKVIPAHSRAAVDTGIHVQPSNDFWFGVFPRSGLALKSGITITNCVGVIDPSYTDSIKVLLYNTTEHDFNVSKGDRIAQLILMPRLQADFEQVLMLDETDRGNGGFGSTGIK